MSEINYCNKVLFLSKERDVIPHIKESLSLNKLAVEDKVEDFSSLDNIEKRILAEKGTSFFRKNLFKYVQEKGYPFLVFIDYTIDFKFFKGNSKNRHLLLRTLLISYIVLSITANCHLNLIILANEDREEELYNYQQFPVRLLDSIKTGNEKINNHINTMRENSDLFDSIFSVKIINKRDLEYSGDEILDHLIAEFKMENSVEHEFTTEIKPVESSSGGAANIIYKLSENEVFLNGNITTYHEDYDRLNSKIIYVTGNWTARTLKEVNEKIITFIMDPDGFVKFNHEDIITINIGDDCTIDNTLAASLAQLIVQKLSSFKDVKVYVAKNNYETLKESKGFSMVKSNVQPFR